MSLLPVQFIVQCGLQLLHHLFLGGLGARYPKAGAQIWKRISKILIKKYGGDLRNITLEAKTIQKLWSELRQFSHLRGNKLSNFYLRAMGEKGLLKISDFSVLDIPVDIQVARFTLASSSTAW